jgi:hypothetical protein
MGRTVKSKLGNPRTASEFLFEEYLTANGHSGWKCEEAIEGKATTPDFRGIAHPGYSGTPLRAAKESLGQHDCSANVTGATYNGSSKSYQGLSPCPPLPAGHVRGNDVGAPTAVAEVVRHLYEAFHLIACGPIRVRSL